MKKPALRRMIAAAALTAMLGVNYANAYDFESNGLYYSVINDGQVAVDKNVTNGTNAYKGVYIIPEQVTYGGSTYKVTAIADSAFNKAQATEVQIPNTVTTIGESAFAYDELLTSITLPTGLKSLSKTVLAGTGITSILVPEGVTSIGYGAFQSCASLQTVMLPSTLTFIDAYGFNNCQSLDEIYCAAATPPKASGWAIFIGLEDIDVIVPSEAAVTVYGADAVWGDKTTFNLYPSEDVSLSMTLSGTAYGDNYIRLGLGNNFGYKIYRGTDLLATTAADGFYLPITQESVTYTVVPTNMLADGDALTYTVAPAAIEEVETESHPIIRASSGTIFISGDNYGTWTRVWDVYGNLYYERPSVCGEICDLPRGRVYIVRVGNYVQKISL